MIAGHFESDTRKYIKDSISSEIKQGINESKEIEIAGFKKLVNTNDISEGFYNLVKEDRDYFYKGLQGSIGFVNYLYGRREQNTLNKEGYRALWKEVFQSHPVSKPTLLTSNWFFSYTENYLRYNEFIKDEINIEKTSEIRKQGLIHTHNIKNAKKYLSGKQLEYYNAAYIHYVAIEKNYEKELVSLFEEYKKEYPTSEYTRFVESQITPIIAFHKKKNEPLNANIKIIDNLNSLEEVVKTLNGKRVYVDVWATWCPPCKKEFKHSTELHKLLKSEDITMLYLSIDEDDREQQWRGMMIFYDLEGYHIRANEKLATDLRNIRGGKSYGIPWHFLTDQNGKIIRKNMSGPSKIDKLEKQLKENNVW